MRAVRFHGRGDIRVDEIEEPVCGDGQVKIRPAFVGICGSDIHEYLAGPTIVPATPHPLTDQKLPTTLGHEFSGTIEEDLSGSAVSQVVYRTTQSWIADMQFCYLTPFPSMSVHWWSLLPSHGMP
ncbi:hypothetical protein DTO012A8_10172 [Penicillium roqueforti]|nr:hypothetical protein DTO012A8_10172 [Penicillium roqueforti]